VKTTTMMRLLPSRNLRNISTKHFPVSLFSTQQEWAQSFRDATSELKSDVSFLESAQQLRTLTKTNLLRASDIRDAPERFFEAHRILARHAVEHGPGFWIRYTVHYNLFAGTVMAVGTDEQVKELQEYQDQGLLGCFSLTEKLAGVQSGLVVETTATWDEAKQCFLLNTPHEGARKNWISQGFVADKTVVVADLIIGGKSKGPHGFVMDFRRDGELVSGISVDDMGEKTVGNDLDNAWLSFDNVELPQHALLSKHADVVTSKGAAEYVLKSEGIRPFDMIGQRLYTGRVAVAQAALEYRKQLFKQTKEYSDNKLTYARGDKKPSLSEIPQLRSLYEENTKRMAEISQFASDCEAALSECLRSDQTPSSDLVDAIATCKVLAVEDSIKACFQLKQEVGSYALMHDSGFKHMDFLQCCKFAEGDSRILMQKMARDEYKRYLKGNGNELAQCSMLEAKLSSHEGLSPTEAWNEEWRDVYALAEAVMQRVELKGVKSLK